MLKQFIVFGLFLTSALAQAETWQCTGQTQFRNPIQVIINKSQKQASVLVEVATTEAEFGLSSSFLNIDDVWDGHMTGLITGSGISVKYENHFGILRNVVVTTNVRGITPFIDVLHFNECQPL